MSEISLENRPDISNFILSLRDIGYSLETAVADIIDNSIAADAKNIFIYADATQKQIAICDDGSGMSLDELKRAMKLGSFSPEDEREKHDLGRFGLGLKTASFSQCKKLSVISQKKKALSGFCWDLDYLKRQKDWIMKYADPEAFKDSEFSHFFQSKNNFTVVVWEDIDRFETENDFIEAIDVLKDHLSLVFHRFMEGEKRKITLYVNNRKLVPFNPFFKEHPATQERQTEKETIYGDDIYITPYILPHPSKISEAEYKKYATRDGYQKSQGFYLYREGRLLIHGTWFRLHKQSEAHKLVRIKIDISNKLDKFWNIDVKKSTATPSLLIKETLLRIIRQITEQGFRVYASRGKIEKKNKVDACFWNIKHVEGKIKFILNRNHPLFLLLKEEIDENSFSIFEKYISDIEEYLPVEDIYARMMQNEKNIEQKEDIDEEKIHQMLQCFFNNHLSKNQIIDILRHAEGYSDKMVLIEDYLEKHYADSF